MDVETCAWERAQIPFKTTAGSMLQRHHINSSVMTAWCNLTYLSSHRLIADMLHDATHAALVQGNCLGSCGCSPQPCFTPSSHPEAVIAAGSTQLCIHVSAPCCRQLIDPRTNWNLNGSQLRCICCAGSCSTGFTVDVLLGGLQDMMCIKKQMLTSKGILDVLIPTSSS